MLTNEELQKFKELREEANKASREKSEIRTIAKEKKAQGLKILQEYGYESFADRAKLKEQLDELEKDILKENAEAEAEIASVQALKQELEKITLS